MKTTTIGSTLPPGGFELVVSFEFWFELFGVWFPFTWIRPFPIENNF